MAKPELGTKRVCPVTGRKFYDLDKDPIVSPYTGQSYPRSLFEPQAKAAPAPKPSEDEEETEKDEDEIVIEGSRGGVRQGKYGRGLRR